MKDKLAKQKNCIRLSCFVENDAIQVSWIDEKIIKNDLRHQKLFTDPDKASDFINKILRRHLKN